MSIGDPVCTIHGMTPCRCRENFRFAQTGDLLFMSPPLPSLFDPQQPVELEHVGGAIGNLILAWCKARQRKGAVEFHADELRQHIANHMEGHTAPASADRILRDLRKRGLVQYVVVNRRASLYRLL